MMRTLIRAAAAAGACALAVSLAACGGDDDPAAADAPTASEAAEIDKRLDAIAGTWQFDAGTGSLKQLIIATDGTAAYSEEGDANSPYRGTVTLGAQSPHVFNGWSADGAFIAIPFTGRHDDTLVLDEDDESPLERIE